MKARPKVTLPFLMVKAHLNYKALTFAIVKLPKYPKMIG